MTLLDFIHAAATSLRQNGVRSVLTTLGVIIGVMAVTLLVSLGEAAERYIEGQFSGLGSNLLRITPGKQETTGFAPMMAGSFRKLTTENANQIRRRAGQVAGVAPMVVGSGAVRHEALERNCMVLGVTEDWGPVRGFTAQEGRFITRADNDKNSPVCLIGVSLKKELFGDGTAINERVSINRRKFLIIGIIQEIGMTLGMDMDQLVFVPLTVAQQMFMGGEDALFQILVSTRSNDEVAAAAESIRKILKEAHDYTEDFTIIDQTSMLSSFDRIFAMLKVLLAGLASISLLVGGIGIMNIMLVSVRERTREVGVRKAVGAGRRDIGMQFLIESVLLSSIGGLAGVAGGYAGAFLLRTLYPEFPVYCSTWATATAFSVSVAVGVYFGVYTAWQAAGVDPVEALRYE